jgi:hypothetical protein
MVARAGFCSLALFCVFALATPLMAQPRPNSITFEEGEEGWMLLFYGSTFDDWVMAGDAEWRIEDGAIISDSGGRGLLHTIDEYSDFELLVDFLAAPGTNSGIFVRTTPNPTDMLEDAYEINIAPPEHDFPTGSVVQRQRVEGMGESDDWRTYHIEMIGGHLKVWLDGEPIVDYEDPEPIESGYIGLQHNQGRIAFRNVKLRYLDF